MMSALLIATVKSESSFEYQATRHLITEPSHASLDWMSVTPYKPVKSWKACDINNFTFYTKAKDRRSQCQNSGVGVDAKDSMGQKNAYYGYIEEI
jgi:hypothetical protein